MTDLNYIFRTSSCPLDVTDHEILIMYVHTRLVAHTDCIGLLPFFLLNTTILFIFFSSFYPFFSFTVTSIIYILRLLHPHLFMFSLFPFFFYFSCQRTISTGFEATHTSPDVTCKRYQLHPFFWLRKVC